jgi:hypothetical protein
LLVCALETWARLEMLERQQDGPRLARARWRRLRVGPQRLSRTAHRKEPYPYALT